MSHVLPHAVNCGRFCFWRRQSVVFCLCIAGPLNGFAPNSHGRRVWSVDRTSLKVKVKGRGHQGQKRHFSALSTACVRFMFGKTSLASMVSTFLCFLANVNVRYMLSPVPLSVCLQRSCTLLRRLKFSAIFLCCLVP